MPSHFPAKTDATLPSAAPLNGADAFEQRASAGLVSLALHVLLCLLLAMATIYKPAAPVDIAVHALPPDTEVIEVAEEFASSEEAFASLGALSVSGPSMASATTPRLKPDMVDSALAVPSHQGSRVALDEIRDPLAQRLSPTESVPGAAGVGVTGAEGALDRITLEIANTLETGPTLVVWIFDRSGSLERQRRKLRERFERIYRELGILETAGRKGFQRRSQAPLLSSIIAFGQTVDYLTRRPTEDVAELQTAVANISTDESGVEYVFSTVIDAAGRFRTYQRRDPERQIMFVLFTDEAGDDEARVDEAVQLCHKLAIPVYVVGVPAPFGRRDALVKYVDPDPRYDQRTQWLPVHQGPESLEPEALKLHFSGMGGIERFMDSGFGPYALTRLCVETGGIYFAVHPNRTTKGTVAPRQTEILATRLSRFFDPDIMRNYQPGYVSTQRYLEALQSNAAKRALVEAARQTWITPMENPDLVFPYRNDADFVERLSRAQRAAAKLEPRIEEVYRLLKAGADARPELTEARWKAGFDLAMGRVLAVKVRTEGYNAMLAAAKQGLRFTKEESDTWRLVPADEVTAGSILADQAEQAREYLERVEREHPQTPWAILAKQELRVPFGWRWREITTGVRTPPPGSNAGTPPSPRDDVPRRAPEPPPRRPPPKL